MNQNEEDFIFEKIPRSFSYVEGKNFVDSAINKFIKEEIEKENSRQMEDIYIIRNSNEVADGFVAKLNFYGHTFVSKICLLPTNIVIHC